MKNRVVENTIITEGITTDLTVTRSGCRSYLTLNIDGNPTDHLQEIFSALQTFEETYGVKIPPGGWCIERRQVDEGQFLGPKIFGIWVDCCLPPHESPMHP